MEIAETYATLERQLEAEIARDPLQALAAIGRARQVSEIQQRRAVRAALQAHSWAEIGQAMGVSKQAAHHRFARAWIDQLKSELKAASAAVKRASRQGDDEGAATAKARLDELIAELKRGKP